MTKSHHLFSTLVLGTCLLGLASCGGGSGSSSNSGSSTQQEVLDDQGIYRAVLSPLNNSLAGETSGTVEIRIEADEFIVRNHIKGAPAGVKHLQNIMEAQVCPSMSHDANGDGIIDASEMLKSTGKILIPLDSNLSEQLLGIDYGPISNGRGNYIYRRSTGFSELLSDLQAIDPDPVDPITKLETGSALNLSGRVVVIHGVRSGTASADTVSSIRGLTNEQMMPIACGRLVRVENEGPEPEIEVEGEAPTTDTI